MTTNQKEKRDIEVEQVEIDDASKRQLPQPVKGNYDMTLDADRYPQATLLV